MKCANCKMREGTRNWVGEAGALAFNHGMYEVWCERCVVQAQLDYAIKSADRIPGLKQKLIDLNKHEHPYVLNAELEEDDSD